MLTNSAKQLLVRRSLLTSGSYTNQIQRRFNAVTTVAEADPHGEPRFLENVKLFM